MTTNVEDTVRTEEQTIAAPERHRGVQRRPRRIRAVVRAAGGVIALLAVSGVVIARFIARAQQSAGIRARRTRVYIQPRVRVFAPSITMSWPLSGITSVAAPGRRGRSSFRGARAERRGRRRLGRPEVSQRRRFALRSAPRITEPKQPARALKRGQLV